MSTKLDLAAQFVNSTNRHIFLTGKAGTGKTTFLHNLAQATHKNYVVVAPTGIAALNAKGVTIHSQFLLPFGSYLREAPRFSSPPKTQFYSRRELASRHSLNKARKEVLRKIELLIIDEVSMLRADLLDALDYRLKSVKGNFKKSFGGVQLLMIGDLFQLPPIVKDEEWQYLQEFYPSAHFFESHALRQEGFTYIELDKIFRQSDDGFIRILNALRENRLSQADLEQLNKHYDPQPSRENGVVTISTHNYRADKINRSELEKLSGASHFYRAEVKDDFPENLFPLPEKLELREGAQVMFVKNDPEGQRFYNGKLASVTSLREDGIEVLMEDGESLWLEKHQWENKKYEVSDSQKELKETVIGTFEQYPIKLAWAITVHKSQGLTFDRAIIDVGEAFAPGQVYVALSRLRSLDGLILRTKISERAVSSDAHVMRFSKEQPPDEELPQNLKMGQQQYLLDMLRDTFDFSAPVQQIEYVQKKSGSKMDFEDPEMREALDNLRKALLAEASNTQKFRSQLERLVRNAQLDKVQERLQKGSDYYLDFLWERLRELLKHRTEVAQLSRTKTYGKALDELDQLLFLQIEQVQKVTSLAGAIIAGTEPRFPKELREERRQKRIQLLEEVNKEVEANPKKIKNKTGRKLPVGKTQEMSVNMLNEGMSPEEVAEKRGLKPSTIYNHARRGVSDGKLDIERFVPRVAIAEVSAALATIKEGGLTELRQALNEKYDYDELRLIQTHLRRQEELLASDDGAGEN